MAVTEAMLNDIVQVSRIEHRNREALIAIWPQEYLKLEIGRTR